MRRIRKKRKQQFMFLGVGIFLLGIMTAGYAAFNTSLTIGAKGSVGKKEGMISGYLNNYRKVDFEDRSEESEDEALFQKLYGDNNGELVYDTDKSIILDYNNAIPVFDKTLREYGNGYTIYITVKGDIFQYPVPETGKDASGNPVYDKWGPATIFGMSTESVKGQTLPPNRVCWFGFRNGFFQIYSFSNTTFDSVDSEKTDEVGFRSLRIDDKYNNKILNIQVVGVSNKTTKVYFNGKLFTEFESGNGNGTFNNATIGDLRPLRGVKFTGNFYDIAIYDKALNEVEIDQNWRHAKETWNIEE